MTPIALGLILGGPISAKLATRIGTKLVVTGGLVLVALGLMIITQFTVDSGYDIVAAHLIVLGFGMGMAMAPATESVMGTLPVEQASAPPSATQPARRAARSASRSSDRSSPTSTVPTWIRPSARCPTARRTPASDTLSGGLAVAHRLGDLALADAAQHAFLNGMHFAALAAAAVATAAPRSPTW